MNKEGIRVGPVVLAGHFDPATIGRLLPVDTAKNIAGIRSSPGVPIHYLAAALISEGINTTVVGGVRGAQPIHVMACPLSVAIYTKRGGWPFILNGLRRERNALLGLLRKIDPVLVHAHWTFEAGRAVGEWNGPKLLTVHDAAWDCARLGFTPNPMAVAFTARWLMNTAATLVRYGHLVAVSPYIETYLRRKERFRGEIRVIPNAVPELPADLIAPKSFPKSGSVTFGCYGEPGGVKNLAVALTAFRRLHRTMPDSRLVVFGSGWEKEARREGNSSMEFRGALPHREFLRSLVEEIDIWVHPSRTEAQSICICEAIQAGCPVIGGKASGAVPWTLDYGNAGFLVDVDNAIELCGAMTEAVSDRRASCELVEHGQRLIRERFNPGRVLQLHLQYYDDILQKHRT